MEDTAKPGTSKSTMQSRGNLHLIPLERSHIEHIDQLEALLLQEGTVWDEEVLKEGLRRANTMRQVQDVTNKRTQSSQTRSLQAKEARSLVAQTAPKKAKTLHHPTRSSKPSQADTGTSVKDLQPSPQSEQTSQAPLQQGEAANTVVEIPRVEPPVASTKKDEARKDNTQAEEDCQDNVIIFDSDSLSPWESDVDMNETTDSVEWEEPRLAERARNLIVQEGMEWRVQGWYSKRRGATVQVITDAYLTNWSTVDGMCVVHHRSHSHLQLWIQEIRQQRIQLSLPITVVALQCIKQSECMEPLKNGLAALCRAIRLISPAGRIFIVNNIPNPRSAPVLGQRTTEHNNLLFRAVTGINVRLERVFYCDIAQHFVSRTQSFLEPVAAHLNSEGQLTSLGCFIYRSCLLREIGVVPYHLRG